MKEISVYDALETFEEPLNEKELNKFMKGRQGTKLPEEYIAFLRRINGGDVIDKYDIIISKREKSINRKIRITWFSSFVVNAGVGGCNPADWWQYQDDMPKQLFPIGKTKVMLNKLYLGLSEKLFGQVFLVDEGSEEIYPDSTDDELLKAKGFIMLADNFSDFLQMLEVVKK